MLAEGFLTVDVCSAVATKNRGQGRPNPIVQSTVDCAGSMEKAMLLLFWMPMIIASGMLHLAFEPARARDTSRSEG
jgi:hypothetical protein